MSKSVPEKESKDSRAETKMFGQHLPTDSAFHQRLPVQQNWLLFCSPSPLSMSRSAYYQHCPQRLQALLICTLTLSGSLPFYWMVLDLHKRLAYHLFLQCKKTSDWSCDPQAEENGQKKYIYNKLAHRIC